MCECITLHVPPHIYVAGGTVAGYVELKVPLLCEHRVEEVVVELRETIFLRDQYGPMTSVSDEQSNVRSNCTVWTLDTINPPLGTDVICADFELALPVSLPPSFEASTAHGEAYIRYYIEVLPIGHHGLHERIMGPMVVVPKDRDGDRSRGLLRVGWSGRWATKCVEHQIRRSPWGRYADVFIEYSLPDIRALPLFVPIPFKISIITISAATHKGADVKTIWPAPPQRPQDVFLTLHRTLKYTVSPYHGESSHVQKSGKEWRPSVGDPMEGQWRQRTTFSSSFVLRCPPTFHTQSIKNEVSFGSPLSGVKACFPVKVTSAMTPSTSLEFYALPAPPPPTGALVKISRQLLSHKRTHSEPSSCPTKPDLPPYYVFCPSRTHLSHSQSCPCRSYWSMTSGEEQESRKVCTPQRVCIVKRTDEFMI
ncbi:uncharacterized protein LAESUDRAFT_674951 [Laetiporus sulphureus 93-53]|uniref:Arrestin-like N-terminal domain-containing protein n=1 Tax=Laetiporus sulphureus 93-53 TaxID=1314785 RepID=A0A165FLV2_9APHY|nr:uncharacterized protein LAESUDRAFT_674951 [Laetiporus sulphureus 93-53]KZT09166.1 hypothetical protein LAESUDRAFT_674951 [Laetiporus sulphureus 93-53]